VTVAPIRKSVTPASITNAVRLTGLITTALLILALGNGCRSTPAKSAGSILFRTPADVTQKAAINALVVTGFDIERRDPLYVEGYRPRRVGFFVGSGGETVGVWLEPEGADRTRVRVDTARTFLGMAGQQDWTGAVVREMERELGSAE
jgi:hypothetical protein